MEQRADEDLRILIRAVIAEVYLEKPPLHKDERSNIALAAAKEALRQDHEHLFGLLGYDIGNKDDIKRLRGDMDFLGALHKGTSNAGSRVVSVSLTSLIGAILILLWWGLKAKFGAHQ